MNENRKISDNSQHNFHFLHQLKSNTKILSLYIQPLQRIKGKTKSRNWIGLKGHGHRRYNYSIEQLQQKLYVSLVPFLTCDAMLAQYMLLSSVCHMTVLDKNG